jgi:hypothetical protein
VFAAYDSAGTGASLDAPDALVGSGDVTNLDPEEILTLQKRMPLAAHCFDW